MENEKITVQEGKIDEVSLEEMQKIVEKGTSTEKQMNRTELNFLCEFFAELKKLNENLQSLNKLYTLVNAPEIKNILHKN